MAMQWQHYHAIGSLQQANLSRTIDAEFSLLQKSAIDMS